jgi:hypothetical protein
MEVTLLKLKKKAAAAADAGRDSKMKARVRQVGQVAVVDIEARSRSARATWCCATAWWSSWTRAATRSCSTWRRSTYMDSAGIGELVACYKRAKEKGGTVKLLNPSGKVLTSSR